MIISDLDKNFQLLKITEGKIGEICPPVALSRKWFANEAVQKGRHPALDAGSPILIWTGDAGSRSGMTKLIMNTYFYAVCWAASFRHHFSNASQVTKFLSEKSGLNTGA